MTQLASNKPRTHPWLATFCVVILLLAIAAAFAFVPQNIDGLISHPNPSKSYAEAVARLQTIQAGESADINPLCRSMLMTHGDKTDRALILVHGYTTCPEQFRMLGKQFFDLGYNVLIPRLPHHGLLDRLTEEQSQLTAEEAVQFADTVVDIGAGLGHHVTMMGLSGGGVITGWAAQNRSDLDLAVLIAPAFGYYQVPTTLTAGATNFYLAIPNSYTWWDPELKEKSGQAYTYPRYSTHTLAQLLRVGFSAQSGARSRPPAAHAILVVTNANDFKVNNVLTKMVAGYWRDHGATIQMFEFDAGLKLKHDLIDPNPAGQRPDIVYPQLIQLVTR
jgi:esterase/lipase